MSTLLSQSSSKAPIPLPPPPPPNLSTKQTIPPKISTNSNTSGSLAKVMGMLNSNKSTCKLKEKDAYIDIETAEKISIPKHKSIIKPSGEIDIGNSGSTFLRVVVWSDTHMAHNKMILPKGDILIHCGDFTNGGRVAEVEAFNEYVGKLDFKYKIAVCGNHEVIIGTRSKEEIRKLLSNMIYLQDENVVIEGIKIYGTPWTDAHGAFHAKKEQRKQKWADIPEDVDILVTHQPPFGILDRAYDPDPETIELRQGVCKTCHEKHIDYKHWGCPFLKERIQQIKPKVHIFGHVHDGFGACRVEGYDTAFVNAAIAFKLRAPYFLFPISEKK